VPSAAQRTPATPPGVDPACPPLSGAPLDDGAARGLAATLKAVADPARLRILSLLQSQPDGEACVCHLTGPLGLSQPTVSHHLRVLREAGLVRCERRGSWVHYRAETEALEALSRLLG
jgi:ArsR family transcriptional regulator, arsenate/arsenite/antimonite-responsive transcriptional repressor